MNILELAKRNQQKAWEIIEDTRIVRIWEGIGAKVNLVGSLRTGLLMKHRDIDFHFILPLWICLPAFGRWLNWRKIRP